MADDEIEPLDDTPNAAEPVDQAHQQRRRKQREDRRVAFWRGVLADADGRAVLWDFFEDCGLFTTTFACSPAGLPVSEGTWFALGKKDVADRLYRTLLRHDHDKVALMHEEHDSAWAKPKRARA